MIHRGGLSILKIHIFGAIFETCHAYKKLPHLEFALMFGELGLSLSSAVVSLLESFSTLENVLDPCSHKETFGSEWLRK